MRIAYDTSQALWERTAPYMRQLAAAADSVCEIGAGANPLLPARPGYLLLDASASELSKAGGGYETLVGDICADDWSAPGKFDLVLSRSVAEHVPEAARFHRNVRGLLREGGVAVHFFSTLYAVPFLANRLLPEWAGTPVLRLLRPGRIDERHGKFPARYAWCRGPTPRQLRRLRGCGFEIEEYVGSFGHGYYARLGLEPAARPVWTWLTKHPVPALTSFALVTLRAV